MPKKLLSKKDIHRLRDICMQIPLFPVASLLEYFFHLFCICVPGVLYLLLYLLCICCCPARKIWVGGQLQTPLFYFASLLEGKRRRYHQFTRLPHISSSHKVDPKHLIVVCFEIIRQFTRLLHILSTLKVDLKLLKPINFELFCQNTRCSTYHPLTKSILNFWSIYIIHSQNWSCAFEGYNFWIIMPI